MEGNSGSVFFPLGATQRFVCWWCHSARVRVEFDARVFHNAVPRSGSAYNNPIVWQEMPAVVTGEPFTVTYTGVCHRKGDKALLAQYR
mgnify:CR=1 FL=1